MEWSVSSSRSHSQPERYKSGYSALSWNSTRKIGRIGRHRAEKPNVEVTMCLGPMPPDASDFPGGIPALRVGPTYPTLSQSAIQVDILPEG